LAGSVRRGDPVARLGGDEFAILLPETDRPHTVNIAAHKIRPAISEQVDVGTAAIRTGISVGIAYAQPGEDPEGLLHRADTALQRAKRGAGINADGDPPA
jgi:diguanylate cyclase (GGDEF)-like protein